MQFLTFEVTLASGAQAVTNWQNVTNGLQTLFKPPNNASDVYGLAGDTVNLTVVSTHLADHSKTHQTGREHDVRTSEGRSVSGLVSHQDGGDGRRSSNSYDARADGRGADQAYSTNGTDGASGSHRHVAQRVQHRKGLHRQSDSNRSHLRHRAADLDDERHAPSAGALSRVALNTDESVTILVNITEPNGPTARFERERITDVALSQISALLNATVERISLVGLQISNSSAPPPAPQRSRPPLAQHQSHQTAPGSTSNPTEHPGPRRTYTIVAIVMLGLICCVISMATCLPKSKSK